ncbi:hypothetical protein D3C71_1437600 [compost metagenome]
MNDIGSWESTFRWLANVVTSDTMTPDREPNKELAVPARWANSSIDRANVLGTIKPQTKTISRTGITVPGRLTPAANSINIMIRLKISALDNPKINKVMIG